MHFGLIPPVIIFMEALQLSFWWSYKGRCQEQEGQSLLELDCRTSASMLARKWREQRSPIPISPMQTSQHTKSCTTCKDYRLSDRGNMRVFPKLWWYEPTLGRTGILSALSLSYSRIQTPRRYKGRIRRRYSFITWEWNQADLGIQACLALLCVLHRASKWLLEGKGSRLWQLKLGKGSLWRMPYCHRDISDGTEAHSRMDIFCT